MKYLILLLFTISLSATTLTKSQLEILTTIKAIAQHFKARDGMTFTKALSAIALTESSLGLQIVGDQEKNKPVSTASLGVFQIRLTTAKYIIRKNPILTCQFGHLLHQDKILTTFLLTKTEFSTLLAGFYLVMNYEIARAKGLSNPWYRAISKHNGGWHNYKYYSKVLKNLHLLEKEIRCKK